MSTLGQTETNSEDGSPPASFHFGGAKAEGATSKPDTGAEAKADSEGASRMLATAPDAAAEERLRLLEQQNQLQSETIRTLMEKVQKLDSQLGAGQPKDADTTGTASRSEAPAKISPPNGGSIPVTRRPATGAARGPRKGSATASASGRKSAVPPGPPSTHTGNRTMRNRTNTSEDSGAGSTRGTARGTRTAPRPSSRLGTSTTRPASRNGTSAKRQLYRENSAGGAKGTSRAGAVTRRPGTAMDQTTRRGQTSISTRTAPRRVGAGSSTSRSASAMGGGAGSVRSATSGKSRSTSTKRKQQAAAASGSTAAKTGPQFSAPRKLHKSGDEAETQASSLGSMLSSAADIRTFGTRDDVQEMELEFANTGFGIKLQYGVTINNKKYEAIVKEIRPGSPCAGKLLVGDRLVTIHGQDIKNTLFKEILQHVREASRKATQGIPQRLGFRLRPREAHAHAVAMGEEEALLVPTEYEDEIDITFNSTPLGLYFTGGRVTDVTRGSQVSEEVGVGDRLIKVDSTDLRLLDDHQIAQFLWDLINKISFTNPKTFTFLRKRRSGRHSAETDNATVRVTSTVQSPRSASRAGSVVSDGGRSAGGGGSALTPAALQRVVDLENSVPAGLPFAAAPNSAITFKVVFTAAPYYMQLQANPNGPGCHVRKVKRHSFASHYLRRYDVLIRVDGNDVTGWTVAEVCKYLETHIPTVDKPRVCVYQRFPRQARSVARSTTSFVTDATFFSPNANAQFNPNSFAAEIQAQQQAQVQRPVAKHGGGSSGAASDDGKSTTSGKGPGAAQDSDLSAAEKAQYRALSAHKTVHTTMEFARKSLREHTVGQIRRNLEKRCGRQIEVLSLCKQVSDREVQTIKVLKPDEDSKTLKEAGFKAHSAVGITWK